jgi:tetratricopeptide (TPR) repeat protein/transcriptional regulator with XRE-family HTH domain
MGICLVVDGQVGVASGNGIAFGGLVRRRRAELGLTMEQLAERTGLSVRAIGDIERGRTGRPRRSSAGLLADALGLAASAAAGTAACMDGAGRLAETSEAVTPRQLPTVVPGFAGRAAELATLTGQLTWVDGEYGSAVAVVSGMAGVGKTALAVRWAHQVADRFGDGQLYADLRGFSPAGPPAAPGDVLHCFIEALGVRAASIPVQADARAGLYRSLLAGRRVLVLLDNAADAEQVRPLLPASPGCLALVTSRAQLTGLAVAQGARPVPLTVMSGAAARELLASRLGAARVAAEPESADRLVQLTGGLPLALAVTAARAAAHPDCPLEVLADELADAHSRLQALGGGDASADVRAAFSWSCHRLSGAAARMFRLLSIHPGPDVTVAAAASIAGITPLAARAVLAELTAGAMLIETVHGRYGCHDLVRAYAAEQSHTRDGSSVRQAAILRMLDHYLHSAHAAALLIKADPVPLVLPPPHPGVRPDDLGTESEAIRWFTAEHQVLLAITAEAAGRDVYGWTLRVVMAAYLNGGGYWHQCAAVQHAALDAARRLDDLPAQARVHRGLGAALMLLGQAEDAHTHLKEALRLCRSLRDQAGQAQAEVAFASLQCQQGRTREALYHTRRALRLFRAAGNTLGQAISMNNIGWDHMQLGDYQRALSSCRQALELGCEAGSHTITGHSWDTLGLTHYLLGQYSEATACYQQAIGEYRQAGHRPGEGGTLGRLGDVQYSNGHPAAAAISWRQALDILASLHHPDAPAIRAKLT